MEDTFKRQSNLMQQTNNCCNNGNDHCNRGRWFTDPGVIVVTLGLIGSIALVYLKSKKKKELEKVKTDEKVVLEKVKSKLAIEEHQKKNESDVEKYRQMQVIKQEIGRQNRNQTDKEYKISLREWYETFNLKCPMPEYSAIPHINVLLNTSPGDFRPAMLLHLLSMYGALCFSKVRAKYLDGKLQTPSLQVVIEGEQGSCKSVFNDLLKTVFGRVVASDSKKLKNEDAENIIQTIGIETSMVRLLEIMANNKGVHVYMMETEIDAVTERFKKRDNLSTATFRKAFSNEAVTLDNKNTKSSVRGTFPVFFNYTFTGTPKAVDRFFKKESYEDGTASRVCFAVIPEIGNVMPEFKNLRKDKLATMQDQIGEWREGYCYHTDENGVDVSAKETIIDLSYINDELEKWRDTMLASNDSAKRNISGRIACMAFRCAMVMHMLAGCSDAKRRNARRQICEFTIYIANYCMERYLYRCSDDRCQQFMRMKQSTMPTAYKPKRRLTNEEIEYWYRLHGTMDGNGNEIGYGTIAKELGCSKDDVRNAFKRYEKTLK